VIQRTERRKKSSLNSKPLQRGIYRRKTSTQTDTEGEPDGESSRARNKKTAATEDPPARRCVVGTTTLSGRSGHGE